MEYYNYAEAQTLDLEWWAVDVNGQIGSFATSGFARFPGRIKIMEYDRMLDYFYKDAPVISSTQESQGWRELYGYAPEEHVTPLVPLEKKLFHFFHNMRHRGERGMYVYDTNASSDNWATYYRILIPTVPLLFQNLPEDIQAILDRVRISISFTKELMVLDEWIPERLFPDDTIGPPVLSIPGKP